MKKISIGYHGPSVIRSTVFPFDTYMTDPKIVVTYFKDSGNAVFLESANFDSLSPEEQAYILDNCLEVEQRLIQQYLLWRESTHPALQVYCSGNADRLAA